MNPGTFFAELKRRNVIRVAGLYLVGAWLLTQVASTVLPTFDVPNWALRGLIITLVLGFIPALIFSWAFELTPQGLKRDEDVLPEQSIAPQTARRMDRMIITVLVLALGYFAFDKFVLAPRRESVQTHPALLPNEPGAATIASAKSIAVLPFENLSDDKANAYFADGIQDEILTKLASIADLKVISRLSTAKYKSKPEDLKTVSQQLSVATVLEGSVQKAADKVRVNVQLIDARTDSHLWAKSYDRELKDLFAVESEVSQEIADALQAKLSPVEAKTLATAPTQDSEAYDLFLRGESEARVAYMERKPDAFDRAADSYRQAIARDPNFAPAIARLVVNQMSRHWWIHSLAHAQLAEVKSTAEHALRLAPTLAEGHIALGLVYYWGYRQYPEALSEFGKAIELQPNSAEALSFSATIHRRQGEWKRSLLEYEKAQRQDPRDAQVPASIGTIYLQLRMWREASRAATHALALGAHEVGGMTTLVLSCLNGTGDVKEARRIMSSFTSESPIASRSFTADVADTIGLRAYLSVMERDFPAALKIWNDGSSELSAKRELGLAAKPAIHVLVGDAGNAQVESEQARGLLEATLREQSDDFATMTQLSWVYLALGRKADALSLARQATNVLPVEKDALLGTGILTNLAEIEARTGQTSEAVTTLRRLLSIPAGLSVSIARLKIDPVWDPIRNDPGFQQLLAGKEQIGPNK